MNSSLVSYRTQVKILLGNNMNTFTSRLAAIFTIILLCNPTQAAQTYFETYGTASVSYSDGTSFFDADADYNGNPDTSASANFGGDPSKIYGFSMSQAYGGNTIGAKVGIEANAIGASVIPYSTIAPAKENAGGYAYASAQATNRYYYSGGGTNMLAHVMMDFVWDGQLLAAMDGVSFANLGSEAQLSYHVFANVVSEGHWNPDGIGWWWNFDVSDTFNLIEEDGLLSWSNGGQTLGNLIQPVSGLESMDVAIIDHGMLQGANASFLVTYGMEVEISINGLDIDEGGLLNVRSDFYDTLGIDGLSGNISPEPFADPVPLPTPLFLLGAGLIFLLGYVKR